MVVTVSDIKVPDIQFYIDSVMKQSMVCREALVLAVAYANMVDDPRKLRLIEERTIPLLKTTWRVEIVEEVTVNVFECDRCKTLRWRHFINVEVKNPATFGGMRDFELKYELCAKCGDKLKKFLEDKSE